MRRLNPAVQNKRRQDMRAATLNRLVTRGAMAVVATWFLIAVLAPVIVPHDPLALVGPMLHPPTSEFPFGTDELGRDLLSRTLWAARVSLPYAFILIAISAMIGATLGGIAGYFGGWVDEVVMRTADLVFAFPTVILAMAVSAALGPGLSNAVVALVIVSWPSFARVVRSLVLAATQSDYVAASRLLGSTSLRALWVDVTPNVVGPILVLTALSLGQAVLLLAGLSFLGLGAQPPLPEWGSMIANGAQYMSQWWLAIFPGVAIVTAVISFNIVGDSLRDALDPRLGIRL